jgi:hypothetical protein
VIEGQKLIYGNQGRRQWVDKAKAEEALAVLLGPDKMYEPREIVSPTVAQKLLKADYAEVKDLVTQAEPQLRLVSLDSKGEAVTPIQFIPTQEPGLI